LFIFYLTFSFLNFIPIQTALRLARHFGTSPGFWLNLQKAFELEAAERANGDRIRAEVAPRAAA